MTKNTEAETKPRSEAFHVPSDIAKLDISLGDVRKILALRTRRKTLQARVDAYPAEVEKLRQEIRVARCDEDELIAAATPVEGE